MPVPAPTRPTRLRLLTAAALVVLPCASALAAEEPTRAAVVSPVLDLFGFGAEVGVPVVCGATTAYIADGGDEIAPGTAEPVVTPVNDGCTTVSTEGQAYVQDGYTQSEGAAALNPFVDPALTSTGDSVEQSGNDYGDLVAPFGPTIAGSGATIRHFRSGEQEESAP